MHRVNVILSQLAAADRGASLVSSPSASVPTANPFDAELIATARKISTRGKGILAADESTGTIGTRFKDITVENNEENRRQYRQLLFTTKGLNKYISGVILYDETFWQKSDCGRTFPKLLLDNDIVVGIKLDEGTKPLLGTNGELSTQGLTDLDKRCKKYYDGGARFAKWRAVLSISDYTPSELSIAETAHSLARYASICQQNGLVPIVEPEILMDGKHDIETCRRTTEKVVAACYTQLRLHNVCLEGTLLKPNMVVAGAGSDKKASAAEVGKHTVLALQRSVPSAVPGITFLSGGMSEAEASLNLNALQAEGLGPRPWALTFSYGRALQKSVLKAWAGKKENIPRAQGVLLHRAECNSLAAKGEYRADMESEASAKESSYVKDYKY
jgi:fructose-bisphosphate aldolase class I